MSSSKKKKSKINKNKSVKKSSKNKSKTSNNLITLKSKNLTSKKSIINIGNTYKKKAKELQDKNKIKKESIIPTPSSSYPQLISSRKKYNYLSESLENKFLILGIVSFLFLFLILVINQCVDNPLIHTGYSFKTDFSQTFSNLYEANQVNANLNQDANGWQNLLEIKPLALLFQGIFGQMIVSPELNEVSSFIVTIAIWLLFFLTVSDIIATFSSFSRQLSYGLSFLMTVIVANFGVVFKVLSFIVVLFSLLFETSVIVGLFGAFLAFLAVNLGIHKLGVWALKRKAMIHIAKAKIGGESLKESIEAIDKAGKAIRNIGEKAQEESKNK